MTTRNILRNRLIIPLALIVTALVSAQQISATQRTHERVQLAIETLADITDLSAQHPLLHQGEVEVIASRIHLIEARQLSTHPAVLINSPIKVRELKPFVKIAHTLSPEQNDKIFLVQRDQQIVLLSPTGKTLSLHSGQSMLSAHLWLRSDREISM